MSILPRLFLHALATNQGATMRDDVRALSMASPRLVGTHWPGHVMLLWPAVRGTRDSHIGAHRAIILKIALCGAERHTWLDGAVVLGLLIASIGLIMSEAKYGQYRAPSFKP
jgi:hypothetical protein